MQKIKGTLSAIKSMCYGPIMSSIAQEMDMQLRQLTPGQAERYERIFRDLLVLIRDGPLHGDASPLPSVRLSFTSSSGRPESSPIRERAT